MTLLALGDSTSCGEGVGVRVPHAQTWPVLLGARLGLPVQVAARPGARACDLASQLAASLAGTTLPPAVVTVLVGGNDVIRPSGRDVASDVGAVLERLSGTGTVALVLRLHDPSRQLPLGPARRLVVSRVARVNAGVDRAVRGRDDVRVLDLDRVVGLRHRSAWAVDRLHPSAHGHAVIATAAAGALGADAPAPPLPRSAPGLVGEAVWLVRHGLPWVALRAPELLPRRRALTG